MPIVEDRDLLVYEPDLFTRAGWLAQRLCAGTGRASELTLSCDRLGPGFIQAGVGPGHVVVVDRTSLEVTGVDDEFTLWVSRLRVHRDDPPIPVGPEPAGEVSVWTFAPQVKWVGDAVLAQLRPLGAPLGVPAASSVLDAGRLARVVAFGTLGLIARSVSRAAGDLESLRAQRWERLADEELRRGPFELDLDADGTADAESVVGRAALVRG